MRDPLGRNITYLRLSVTELCNLRCRYCMPAEGVEKRRHEDMLTEEETVRAVKAAASLGLSKVRLTGGEPLVKKNILSIAEKAGITHNQDRFYGGESNYMYHLPAAATKSPYWSIQKGPLPPPPPKKEGDVK